MRLLLDTHIFISLINEDNSLETSVINSIEDTKNDMFISIASLWEIIIKLNIGKLIVTRNLDEMYAVIDKHTKTPFRQLFRFTTNSQGSF
jgi:PIN domain nuclease of toxin-antitoxin system